MKNLKLNSFKLSYFLFFILFSFGILLRFYNINWGAPYYFHPDERNIASSITRIEFPYKMNPEFFAYGSLPIYTTYFLGILKNTITSPFLQNETSIVKFEDAILIGRLISFFLSIGVILIIYKIANSIVGNKKSLITTLFATFSVGFVQYSHFMTFEMWLTFFTSLLLFLIFRYINKSSLFNFSLINLTLGTLLSIKISSLILLPVTYLILFLIDWFFLKRSKKINIYEISKILLKYLIGLFEIVFILLLTSPYLLLDWNSFIGSINYETEVATGKMQVFYTQGFINSIPIVYQIKKIYPFILNPFTLLLFLVCLPIVIFKNIRKPNSKEVLIIIFFIITFLSQAFLFVKWTRYYIPTLPFIYLIIGIYFSHVGKKTQNALSIFILLISVLYSFSYVKSNLAFSSPVAGSKEFSKYKPATEKTLSEIYDMGIVPFNNYSNNITLFNFYDLEIDPAKQSELSNIIQNSSYIILPSQRLLRDRLEKPNLFPKGNIFYSNLMNGSLGFKKIYETPCDLFCKILYANDPVHSFESTTNVFDRPQVMIFKK